MSKLETNTIDTISGSTTLTLGGTNANAITIPSGVTLTNNGTASGFGKVLQVVSATDSTQRSTTSTSFVTASNTLSVSITPSSASNKILILASSCVRCQGDNGFYTIFRGATDLGAISNKGLAATYDGAVNVEANIGINYLDSPSTTSATTYQLYFRSGTVVTNTINMNSSKGSITAIEIQG